MPIILYDISCDIRYEILYVYSSSRPVPYEFRKDGCFGINLFPDNEGEISVGDEVYVTY